VYGADGVRPGLQRRPLGDVLRALSDDARWEAFEGALNRRLLRVYDLNPERVLLDTTTASGHWTVTPGGLFQLGHSKNRRPDLPQVKVKLATLGMPLATVVVSGERADDHLHIPAIGQVGESLGRRGLLYIGDCKMTAPATRAFVQAGGDFYLCPLSQNQPPPEGWRAGAHCPRLRAAEDAGGGGGWGDRRLD